MNLNTNEKLKSVLEQSLVSIESELISISAMAEELSDKFKGFSKDIDNFSGIIGLIGGKEMGQTTKLISKAVNFLGDIYSEHKKSEALKLLLPKKQELANIKINVITNFLEILNKQSQSLNGLLTVEINREYNNEKELINFETLYGNSCKDTYELVIYNHYLIEVCTYILEEFKAWLNGKNESDFSKPDKTLSLEYVLDNDIFQKNKLIESIKFDKGNGGVWLLSKNKSLFAAFLNKIYKNGESLDVKNNKRITNNNSFKILKKNILEIDDSINIKETRNYKWLTDETSLFNNAKKAIKLESLNLFLFKYFFVYSFIALLIIYKNKINLDFFEIISALILSVFMALFFILFSRLLFWVFDDENSERSIWYYLLFLFFTILTLGVLPIAFYKYQKKERNYLLFINSLKTNING